jgi:hypothetical protein
MQTTYNPDDQSTVDQYIISYIAVSDNQLTTGIEAGFASAGGVYIPVVSAIYTIGGQYGFQCVGRRPKRSAESPLVWEIQCEFHRKYKKQPPENPTKWATDISISGQKFTQTTYVDKDGLPVQNSAGQAYDPGAERTYYDEVINLSYLSLSDESAAFAPLRGKVNAYATTFSVKGMTRTFGPRQLLFDDANFSTSYFAADSTTPIWKVSLTFIGRQDSFVNTILDQGYYSLDPGTNKLVAIKDKYGDLVSAPARLNGSGRVLTPGAASVYKTYKIEGEENFDVAFAGL